MAMSRKDYRAFAEYFRESFHLYSDGDGIPAHSMHYSESVGKFADVLEKDNPRFDRAVFVDACGAHPFYAGVSLDSEEG